MHYKLIQQPNPMYSVQEQILVNRGIPYNILQEYINTTDDCLEELNNLDNISAAGFAIANAIATNKKMFIQVDSDCDGYTSSAYLLNYLYYLNPEYVEHYVTYYMHTGKEHGIILDVIPEQVDIVIIPDAGSNQYEEHKELYDKNIQVIVLDHHEANRESEYAIVVNNQLSQNCQNKGLSGVGIVYKTCKQIDKILNVEHADKLLDILSLGMIADVMDLRNIETKHLINKGLENIQNPLIKALVEKQSYSLGNKVTPIGIGFYIAPMINAVIRVGTQEEKLTIFQSLLEFQAYNLVPSTKRGSFPGEQETIVTQATRIATNCRNRQKKLRDEGQLNVISYIETNGLNNNKIIVVNSTGLVEPKLTGLVANQIMSKYQKPTLILRDTGQDLLEGSARGYDKSDLTDLKGFILDSELCEYAEGHSSAFGTGFKKDMIEKFIQYSNDKLKNYDFTPTYNVDFIFTSTEIKPQTVLDIANLKSLWGKGVEESLIVVTNIPVGKNNLQLLGREKNPTLKIQLNNGLSIMKFGSSIEEYESLLSNPQGTRLNIVGTCSVNEWQGNISPQILIKEYEVVETVSYYF